MILVVDVCAERLHYYEFVKPIEDILYSAGVDYFGKHYSELGEEDLAKADKVIICGTSLRDNKFVGDISKFGWIRDFEKPVLGICAGFQIIGLVSGGKLKEYLEIGYFYEEFKKKFLELKGEAEVYHLHNNFMEFPEEFEIYAGTKIPQAVKHKKKEIYGTLFHPEVRQKKMILEFAKI